MLEKHPLRQHATEEDYELNVYVPLGLMERKQQQRRPANQDLPMEEVYKLEEKEGITRQFKYEQFLEHIGLSNKPEESNKNIAIIGEPGAGKSTLLEKIAKEIEEQNKGLPICISLANLERLTLEEYLEQKWLKSALPIVQKLAPQAVSSLRTVTEELKDSLAEQFNTEETRVWLLLDGLDEMIATSPTETLTTIEKQIRSNYLAKARVVLSCRLNVWDAKLTNPFSKFDIYKTLEFEDFQRDKFIQQWFDKLNKSQLGTNLITELKETRRDRIRKLVKNPMRLALLCRIWTLRQGKLPDTKAELYQCYLPYFYNWKKNIKDLTKDDELQTELHKALGKLAIKGLESGSRYRLKRSIACQEMGKELFRLAEDLGWLNIVDRILDPDEEVYAFFHPTFQEYFAACVIEDWDFFLPRNHINRPVKDKKYHIFEQRWKEVILLWLGREKIAKKEKEEFIRALVEFEDGCSNVIFLFIRKKRRFYKQRALFLAATGINEFKECYRTKEIVTQIVECYFGMDLGEITFDIENPAKTALTETTRIEAISVLIEFIVSARDEFNCKKAVYGLGIIGIKNPKAITALKEFIAHTTDDSIRWVAAENLKKIDPDNYTITTSLEDNFDSKQDNFNYSKLLCNSTKIDLIDNNKIAFLENLVATDNDKDTRWQAIEKLERIDPKNTKLIAALEDFMVFTGDTYTRRQAWQAIEKLERIDPKNLKLIANLENLVEFKENENICLGALDVLRRIDPKNLKLIAALEFLVTASDDEFIRWQAIGILTRVDPKNLKLIAPLEEFIDYSEDQLTRIQAAESLGKIDPRNPKVIATLVKSIDSVRDNFNCIHAAYSLEKILTKPLMPKVVKTLKNTKHEEAVKVLWHCAQNLSYPEFYSAWHSQE